MTKSTALVTGGAGFIGSNLADALLAEGSAVHVVDDLSHGQVVRVPAAAEFHERDIRDSAGLLAIAQAARPSVIYHLAAQADVRRALDEPSFDADVNIIGTIAVLEAAHAVEGLERDGHIPGAATQVENHIARLRRDLSYQCASPRPLSYRHRER